MDLHQGIPKHSSSLSFPVHFILALILSAVF
jgi:hypothetical protein